MTIPPRGKRPSSVGGEEQVKRRDASGSRSLGTTSAIQQGGFAKFCAECVSLCDCSYDIAGKILLLVNLTYHS